MRLGEDRRKREALVDKLLNMAWWIDGKIAPSKRAPGQVIERLSPETREQLRELTADDFQRRPFEYP